MKALVLEKYNMLVYQEVPLPEPGQNSVLIKVEACGICGSDVHGLDGSTGRRKPPVIMGHEAAGIISKTGSKVSGWETGERVTFDSTIYCGTCRYCRRGEINLCDNRRVLGVSCDEYQQNGAFAEYVTVPTHILYKLPEKVSFAQAALVEPLSIAVHAVNRTPVTLNDTALVIGCGTIGLLVIQTLKVFGCNLVIAVDIDDFKLAQAKKMGADITINSCNHNAAAEVLKHTDGGVDFAIEAVGITPTLQTAISALRKGGFLTVIGNLSPHVELPLQKIVTQEINLHGSCASKGEYPTCLDLISRQAVNVESLISVKTHLSEGALWFKRLYDRQENLLKVILTP